MSYMTFEEQMVFHLQFLQQAGLKITNLTIDSPGFIRCLADGEIGRGEYAYRTISKELNNKMMGLMTWCRSKAGKIDTYKTHGYAPQERGKKILIQINEEITEKNQFGADIKKIQQFWELSSHYGESDYLIRKGVKSYRIRFRENQYGRIAVIPMKNVQGQLRGYQILNADGSKLFAKGIRLKGLFHQLTDLVDNVAIGIAESYVTAATCFELLPMPMVTAFTSDNLEHVAAALRERYPLSPLVIFADNDRHLRKNKGIINAVKALRKAKGNGAILAPHFRNLSKNSNYSDWNDLVREIGPVCASEQIWQQMQKIQDDRIKTFYI